MESESKSVGDGMNVSNGQGDMETVVKDLIKKFENTSLTNGDGKVTWDLIKNDQSVQRLVQAYGEKVAMEIVPALDAYLSGNPGRAAYIPSLSPVPLNPKTGIIKLQKPPFNVKEYFPLPSATIKKVHMDHAQQIDAIIDLLPIVPVSIKTPKLPLLLTGQGYPLCMNALDLLRQYLTTIIFLRDSYDDNTGEEGSSEEKLFIGMTEEIMEDLKKQQMWAFEQFSSQFDKVVANAEEIYKNGALRGLCYGFLFCYLNAYEIAILRAHEKIIPKEHWQDFYTEHGIPHDDYVMDDCIKSVTISRHESAKRKWSVLKNKPNFKFDEMLNEDKCYTILRLFWEENPKLKDLIYIDEHDQEDIVNGETNKEGSDPDSDLPPLEEHSDV